MIARVAVFGRRACAALAACSAVLHGIALVHATNLAATALTVAMLVACLHCAHDLWVRGTLRGWIVVASMNLVMIAIHVPAPPAHHYGAGVTAAAPHSTVMTLATALAAVEIVVAAAVVCYRIRAIRRASVPRTRPALEALLISQGAIAAVRTSGARCGRSG